MPTIVVTTRPRSRDVGDKASGEQLKGKPRKAKRKEVEMARAEASGGRKGDNDGRMMTD